MRRLLTGYAVQFNRRRRRHGHLFQNRYKSILCQEDVYLKELVRYIHLNPLRAKLVADYKRLNNYRYAGHSALMGKCPQPWQKVNMIRRWLIAVVVLPIPVAVLIPAVLVYACRASRWAHSFPAPSSITFWLGVAAGVSGFSFSLWSVLAFARHGEGTPAPWDPPTRFVAYGPYRFVRNPMILGVFWLLLGETILLRSIPLFVWFALFVLGNFLYIPLIEEKGLERRFGTSYSQYKKNVPRWFPRLTAWHSSDKAMHEK